MGVNPYEKVIAEIDPKQFQGLFPQVQADLLHAFVALIRSGKAERRGRFVREFLQLRSNSLTFRRSWHGHSTEFQ